jgi:hypothetical protein
VATKPLAEFLTLWVKQQDWDRDVELADVISPIAWLAQETGLTDRSIRRVLSLETKFTVLNRAEALLQAVGRPDLIAPGGLIEVVPNPMWNPERWQRYMAERGCDD